MFASASQRSDAPVRVWKSPPTGAPTPTKRYSRQLVRLERGGTGTLGLELRLQTPVLYSFKRKNAKTLIRVIGSTPKDDRASVISLEHVIISLSLFGLRVESKQECVWIRTHRMTSHEAADFLNHENIYRAACVLGPIKSVYYLENISISVSPPRSCRRR